ncbi:MAG TPA: hypothetical protein VME43_33985 [Bryobacteraceae bacterium]|nr:hypothetical protein [Bryobacteraceae bacterium]
MSPQQPGQPDSLEIVEIQMALEEILSGEAGSQRAERLRELRARLAQINIPQDLWDDLGGGDLERGDDDDLLATFARKLGPKGPLGESGAAAQPDRTDRPEEDEFPRFPLV